MIHVRLSPTLNFQFGAFTVLVLLICSCQTHVIGPTRPIAATVGEDVILQSFLDPVMDAFGMTVEWTRPAMNPSFVYVWRDGVELESKKHPLYEGRTSVFTEELKRGNISLKLSRVRISDEGRYRCFIPALDKDHVVQLVVGAASSPVVQKTKDSSGLVLQCESTGWYPEPEMFWLDGEGNLLSAGPTETVRGPDDLYTVSSRVTVEKRHSNSFTCRVQQNSTNQIRETQIHVPDDFFEVQSSSSSAKVGLAASFAVSILFNLILGFFVWKYKTKRSSKDHRVNEEETESKPLMKMKELKKGKAARIKPEVHMNVSLSVIITYLP
uniref:Butyrophilin subfamily 3 member A2-like n=1 Tax=Sparus aurata TaxID=8175 RepID=A0A671TLV2_SPAAU